MVIVKLAIVAFVIIVGSLLRDPKNWHPFAPFGYTGPELLRPADPWPGIRTDAGGKPVGMLAGSAIIFFAYIGFDSVSTHSEEAKNPKRDLPIGIIVSLILCTFLYIAVAAVLTGMIPYDQDQHQRAGVRRFRPEQGLPWANLLISVGALTGITSVLLVMMLSQPRVFLAMARDGLVPPSFFGAVHPKYLTPWKSTILIGVAVGLMGSLLPLRILAELVSIGTLFAFVVVCGAVMIMRKTNPDAERPFRAPLVPLTPILGIAVCLLLMFSLPGENWLRLIIWLALGLIVYFAYGKKHSALARHNAKARLADDAL